MALQADALDFLGDTAAYAISLLSLVVAGLMASLFLYSAIEILRQVLAELRACRHHHRKLEIPHEAD